MAIQDSPESVSTAPSTTLTDSNLTSVRRRPIANSENAVNDSKDDDRNPIGAGEGRFESGNGLINGTDGGGEKVGNGEVRERIGGAGEKVGNGEVVREGEGFYKFAYRPSAPTHRGIKESPLSSDAIFKQVAIQSIVLYIIHSS